VHLLPWSAGRWTTPPDDAHEDGAELLVTATEGSDAWRHTSYGFVHDDAHGLLAPLAVGEAVEVEFDQAYDRQFDQAGVLLRADEETWVKAGVEVSDGAPQVGAVVTLGRSDWSVGAVPAWSGRAVTVRLSRAADSVTVRARVDQEPWRLVRVAPFPGEVEASAGPYCCAPTRPGLTVRFRSWRVGPADAALHEEDQ
jgi:regulation of enolase protein 1 (concanavalin A-like superfamily)